MKTLPSNYPADRLWTVGEIPQRAPESLSEIPVRVSYDGDSNALTAEALDHYVIPLFKIAPRLLEVISRHLPDWLTRFTPEENELLIKLADTPMYAIGTEHLPDEFGMWWGPSPNMSAAMSQHPAARDVLFKFTTGKHEIIARSDGSKWIPERTAE